MTQWVQATLPVRNAVIVKDKTGEWVKAEFDTDAIAGFVAPLVLPTLISESVQNEDFVTNMAESLTPQMGMKLTAELMEHMTGEELSAIFSRFSPPEGPSGD
jgi:hypothetical protein